MRLTLILPGLARLDRDVLARSRALSRIDAWSRRQSTGPGLAAAVLRVLGAPAPDDGTAPPIAPALAHGAGLDPGVGYLLAATPVSLEAGVEDVLVAQRIDDLEQADAQRIVARLSGLFAGDGVVFEAPRADAWFARVDPPPKLATSPLDAVLGGMLSAHLPRGDDARTWQRWTTEIQMMLHADPVNVARGRQGRRPFNGLWFWGGGTARDLGLLAPFRAHVPAGGTGDLLRGLALESGGEVLHVPADFHAVVEAAPATRPAAHIAVVIDTLAGAAALERCEAAWLAPANDALARGRLARLDLVTEGAVWTAHRPGVLGKLRARLGAGRFEPAAS